MKKTTLVIMAAGIGSRYGGGIKQLASVDASGHIIMDYSIHDAIEAGFNQILFIIRKDIEKDFREVIGTRIEEVCSAHGVEVGYCFQSLTDIPGTLPEGRTKPWGTGQAVLAAKDLIDSPFAVINADDYYGKSIYKEIHDYLQEEHPDNAFCMAGFILKNTLSDNGGVTRGICQVRDGFLTNVVETKNIQSDAVADGDGQEEPAQPPLVQRGKGGEKVGPEQQRHDDEIDGEIDDVCKVAAAAGGNIHAEQAHQIGQRLRKTEEVDQQVNRAADDRALLRRGDVSGK